MKIELDLTPEQAEKVKKMLAGEKKEWVNRNDTYYFLRDSSCEDYIWIDSAYNKACLKKANVYRTKEAVEQADRQRLALGAIHQYVRDNGIKMAGFNGYIPNWNESENKWQILGWEFGGNKPRQDSLWTVDLSSHGLIFATEEDRKKVLDNCAKELEDLLKVDYSIIR